MSDEEELEFWELLHQPLQKENAKRFQKIFKVQEELKTKRIIKEKEYIKVR